VERGASLERLERDAKERAQPVYRKAGTIRHFHDGLDAVALFEPAVTEFGYSMSALSRAPGVRAG
jgi:hypothetical protein